MHTSTFGSFPGEAGFLGFLRVRLIWLKTALQSMIYRTVGK
jgi:hypothetical protein